MMYDSDRKHMWSVRRPPPSPPAKNEGRTDACVVMSHHHHTTLTCFFSLLWRVYPSLCFCLRLITHHHHRNSCLDTREFSQSTFRSLKDVHPINCSCYTRRILNGLCACEQASPDHSVANGKWTIHGWQTIFRYKSKCDIPKLLDYQWYQKVS